jgi:hypothetical protein
MTKTIEALRKIADECQQRANHTSDRALKAELFDLTTQRHRSAGQAAARRANQRFACPVPLAKIFLFSPYPNHFICTAVPSHRGATRDRHGRGTGCGGRGRRQRRERLIRGRRSRVVLTPRRWRQVGGSNSADDGDKKARSPGRARRKPLKPLRGECRAFSGVTVVTNARVYYTTRAAAGASGARHSLRPLFFEGQRFCTTRTHRAAGRRIYALKSACPCTASRR